MSILIGLNGRKRILMSKRFELAIKYTQKYKHLLKPCRYCKNTDIHIVSDRTIFDNPPRNVWSVVCGTHNCDCTGVHTKVKDAVDAWNRQQNSNG